jgi:hypothetical protein
MELLLGNIDAFQWVIIGLGAVLLFWPFITGLFKQDPVNPSVPENPKVVVDHDDDHCLTSLVCKWECLSDSCHEAGLTEATKKLDEVFPLLLGVREDKIEIED